MGGGGGGGGVQLGGVTRGVIGLWRGVVSREVSLVERCR